MFRTDWAGRSMVRTQRTIADYDTLMNPIRAARLARSGKQQGDPVKAARAILAVAETKNPPAHLLLGPDAVKAVREMLVTLNAEITAWEGISSATDFE